MLRRRRDEPREDLAALEARLWDAAPEALQPMQREYLRRRVFDNLGPQLAPRKAGPRGAQRWAMASAAAAAGVLLFAMAVPAADWMLDRSGPDLARAEVVSGQLRPEGSATGVVREGTPAIAIGPTTVLLMDQQVRLQLEDGARFTFYEGFRLDVTLTAGGTEVSAEGTPVVISGEGWQAVFTQPDPTVVRIAAGADGAGISVVAGVVVVSAGGETCTATTGEAVQVSGGVCFAAPGGD